MPQFWRDPHQITWGADFDGGADYNQPVGTKNSQVIYYPQLGKPNLHATAAYEQVNWDTIGWPLDNSAEFSLEFTLTTQGLGTSSDDWLWTLFPQKWDELYPDQPIDDYDSLAQLEEWKNIVHELDAAVREYHHLGGYPIFAQGDPRDFTEKLDKYTINLLTIVSDFPVMGEPARAEIM